MKFYYISDDYLKFINPKYDSRVMQPNIIGAKKFVFGIVLNIGGINYYAPVSSIDRKKANKNHLNETINFIKFCVHEIKQTETHKQMLFKNPGSRIQELNKI